MPDFVHLHNHTQFSLLDGASSISKLYKKAVGDNQKAIAITDHGNMFGVFQFVAESLKYNKDGKQVIKPIIGCEFYMAEDRLRKSFTKEDKDKRYHQLLLAKNVTGYNNLSKLCSLGYLEGLYSKWPRIDKALVAQYSEGLIATSCCLGAIIPKTFESKGEEAAEKELQWWLDVFGEDFYIELQRHDLPQQEKLNEVLIKFAHKYQIKMICTNDSHYIDQKDSDAHDILLCVNMNEKKSTPIAKDYGDEEMSHRDTRFGFPNDKFYFKTQKEMNELFYDVPESLDNTMEIVSKIDVINLKKDILLPNFPIPEKFKIHTQSFREDEKTLLLPEMLNQWEYLKDITYLGAKTKYETITPAIQERLDFELGTIRKMGFAGYFLIVADFIKAGKDLGVIVGPGRGSAAGSAVAYCIGITNIDPIKYDLLFERFLNPDRKSMPDIDTDFDDEGRQKVIDYVVEKYGKEKVAQIVTYGKMAAKMSVKDVARVMELSPDESNGLTKLFPSKPIGINLKQILHDKIEGVEEVIEIEDPDADNEAETEPENKDVVVIRREEVENVLKLREYYNDQNSPYGEVLRQAEMLEGSVRSTGVHAAGIIIAPKDLVEILPIATSKDSELYLTQFDGKVVEDSGVIKMDFLGLKTLSIIKKAVELIKMNHGVEIDVDTLPLDDIKTYELYQRGDTLGTFQFESPGMQKYLKELKPDKFEDLIAMNALYRPGPMEYIPLYIKRKHGLEEVIYDIPELEDYLKDTYGITVYQEQVMLLSQSLAGFSKGKADELRKAMGKKNLNDIMKLKDLFISGVKEKQLDVEKCEKIWKDWEAFASYAFNKSHSTCYALVAYQTAYLKAHYTAEYMAAVLSNNSNNLEKLAYMMEECKRMKIKVLGPDVNESLMDFSVNKNGEIRFGLCAVKGVGEGPAENIIEERTNNGEFKSIFDLTSRCNLKVLNKRTLEALVKGGGFDFDKTIHKAQLIEPINGVMALDLVLKYGASIQENKNSNQNSLFGEGNSFNNTLPRLPKVEPYSIIKECEYEKEMIGIFIKKHPIDTYKCEYKFVVNTELSEIQDLPTLSKKSNILVGGLVLKSDTFLSKKDVRTMKFTLQDYNSQYDFFISKETLNNYANFINVDDFVVIKLSVSKSKFAKVDDDKLYMNVVSIQKLEDMNRLYFKSLSIKISVNKLDSVMVDNLFELFNKYPGDKKIEFLIIDPEKKYKIDLFSIDQKVNICNDFIADLDQLDLIYEVKLNSFN